MVRCKEFYIKYLLLILIELVIDVEKNNLKRMNTHANARIQACMMKK